jgi:P4 family phage/plasmid primase-like protien
VKERGKKSLTRQLLVEHFRATRPEKIVGLHTHSPSNTSLWGAIDGDVHEGSTVTADTCLAAGIAWHDRLRSQGLTPLLTGSNGEGGYHLRFLLKSPAPSSVVFRFLDDLMADYPSYGLDAPPERYPKQESVAAPGEPGQYGNWLRLPGLHHTRPYWSEVWDGSQWRTGASAVDYILGLRPSSPELLTRVAKSGQERRIRKYLESLPGLGVGQGRDNVGFTFAAYLVRDEGLSDDEALLWLREWDRTNATPKGDERLRQLIANAHRYGRHHYNGSSNGNSRGPIPFVSEDDDNEARLTDVGNGRRLIGRHGQDLRHCHPWKAWLVWDGARWAEDNTGEVVRRVKDVAREFFLEISAKMEKETDAEQRTKLLKVLKHAIKWHDARTISRCLDMARSEHGVPVLPADLDRDPWLLNVANGTLDLRTSTLRPHNRNDLLTKITRIDFDEKATCPLWLKFLERILGGNRDLVDYLQRVIGYTLTGDVREQCLWFFHGGGANGKSTFLLMIKELLGDYGMQAVSDLLMVKNHEAHPTERADLVGKRFVATIETEEGKRMAEAFVKQLTGGESVRARKMRQDFFEFLPTHKIFLAANHKPIVRGSDLGAWRRIKLIPFTVTIPDGEKDKTLLDKLKGELPGILAWAVRGCLEWQRFGLEEPKEVQAAIQEYRAEQDAVQQFLDECCILEKSAKTIVSALFKAFQVWSGDKHMTRPEFGKRLQEKGFEAVKGSQGYHRWVGIHLSPPASSDREEVEQSELE